MSETKKTVIVFTHVIHFIDDRYSVQCDKFLGAFQINVQISFDRLLLLLIIKLENENV